MDVIALWLYKREEYYYQIKALKFWRRWFLSHSSDKNKNAFIFAHKNKLILLYKGNLFIYAEGTLKLV